MAGDANITSDTATVGCVWNTNMSAVAFWITDDDVALDDVSFLDRFLIVGGSFNPILSAVINFFWKELSIVVCYFAESIFGGDWYFAGSFKIPSDCFFGDDDG